MDGLSRRRRAARLLLRGRPADMNISRHADIANRTEVFDDGPAMFAAAYPASFLPEENGNGIHAGSGICPKR